MRLQGRGGAVPAARALRPLLGWAAVIAVAAAVVALTPGRSSGQPQVTSVQLEQGAQLYAVWCAACHGTDGSGLPGAGNTAGPPIDELDAAYSDLLVRTGRMPIVEPRVGIIERPGFTEGERTALVSWMADAFGVPLGIPEVAPGDPGRGQQLYAVHCAQCHGATGAGGVSGGGTVVRAARGVDAVAIVEATRIGPFDMPRFDEQVISDQEVADIAAFTTAIDALPKTPLGMSELHRVTMGALALLLGGAGVLLAYLVGSPVRAPRRRAAPSLVAPSPVAPGVVAPRPADDGREAGG